MKNKARWTSGFEMDWFLKFTRELSLPTVYSIVRGYANMQRECGEGYESLLYAGKDGVMHGYRSAKDDARVSAYFEKKATDESFVKKMCEETETRFLNFRKSHDDALASPNAENFNKATGEFTRLWEVYMAPVYLGSALEKRGAENLARVAYTREKAGGSAKNKGAEGLYEELVCKTAENLERKTRISKELLLYALPHELAEAIEGKQQDAAELAKRKRCWVVLKKRGEVSVYAGEEAEKVYEREIGEPENIKHLKEVRGTTVSGTGMIKGTARVVMKRSQLKKVEEGDVVIAPMTSPEFVPALEKASCIVTDEGGMTCHAAIIARELKKPCIIGTRHATEVFGDGQLVEVDLDEGTVRKK